MPRKKTSLAPLVIVACLIVGTAFFIRDRNQRRDAADGVRYCAHYLRNPQFQDADSWAIIRYSLSSGGSGMSDSPDGSPKSMDSSIRHHIIGIVSSSQSANAAADELDRYANQIHRR
jgi:hypothetical protein